MTGDTRDRLAVEMDRHWLYRGSDGAFGCSADDWRLGPDSGIAEGDRVAPFSAHIADALLAAGFGDTAALTALATELLDAIDDGRPFVNKALRLRAALAGTHDQEPPMTPARWLVARWCALRGHWWGPGDITLGSEWYQIGATASCRRCGQRITGDIRP